MSLSVDVKKAYPDFHLSVSFESGSRRIGILGASGCGKSLTLKSVAGLIRPDQGSVRFQDTVLFDSEKKINVSPGKRRVGYLFQNYALFPNMTVEENIEAALRGKRCSKAGASGKGKGKLQTAQDILTRFNLGEIKDHRPHELSGGQQQRTALARMLATDPELLLLDEPFSAMDTFLREGLRLELIRMLKEYDKTVVLVSHDRDEIYQLCSYLVLMEGGAVIAQGDKDELFRHPKTVAAARLTGCKNISRIKKLDGHRVKALDWNGIELVIGEIPGEEVTHVGIRAHDFTAGKHGSNVISCGKAAVSKLPFEWYVTLENGLWWKLGKALDEEYTDEVIPEYISVEPDKILPLSGTAQ